MSTQGVHSFENEDATQWATAYCEMGFDVAASTIRIALEDFSNNRLSASIAARGVAAVEAVAFALGRGSAEAQRLFKTAPMADPAAAEALVDEANDLLSAVAKASELSTRWAEIGANEHKAWVQSIEALQGRLTGTPAAVVAPATDPAPAAAPPETAAKPPKSAQKDELTQALLMLAREVESLRQENREHFARLSQQIEALKR